MTRNKYTWGEELACNRCDGTKFRIYKSNKYRCYLVRCECGEEYFYEGFTKNPTNPPELVGEEDTEDGDVHTEHCCKVHGCKYGDADCTVVTGKKKQAYPCESCMYTAGSVY